MIINNTLVEARRKLAALGVYEGLPKADKEIGATPLSYTLSVPSAYLSETYTPAAATMSGRSTLPGKSAGFAGASSGWTSLVASINGSGYDTDTRVFSPFLQWNHGTSTVPPEFSSVSTTASSAASDTSPAAEDPNWLRGLSEQVWGDGYKPQEQADSPAADAAASTGINYTDFLLERGAFAPPEEKDA